MVEVGVVEVLDIAAALPRVRFEGQETLRRNWREGVRKSDGVRFAYTRPSPSHYPFQWYWDSCFSAMVWRRFDPTRARAELESLLGAQRDDGFIGHTIFWDMPLNRRQRLTYNVLGHGAQMTASIQPPALAWAWRIAVGDPGAVPAIGRQVDWLAEHRDLNGDGLIWIVQPDESGLDASPQFDAIWRGHADGLPGFVLLVRRNRALGYDLRRIAEAGGPVCCEVLTNVLYALSRLSLGRASLTSTIVERMYDERAGLAVHGEDERCEPLADRKDTHALNEPVSDGAAAQCTDFDEERPDLRARDGDAMEPEFDVHTPTGATSTGESHHEGDPGADPRKANPHELMRRERRRAGD